MEIRKFSKETDSFQTLSDLYILGLGDSEPDYWKWKYDDKNGFDSQEMFVITEDEKIIAMMGYLPMHYLDGDGEVHKFAHLCDLVVHPDFRGGGKFYQITEAMKEDATNKGYDGFYTFPNVNSTHGFEKMGYTLIDLNAYYLKKNYGKILLHKIGIKDKLKNTNYRVEILSENIGAFADKIDKSESWLSGNSVRLDVNKDFIKWRCDDYKYGEYKSIALYDGEKLVAYFVVLVTRGRLVTAIKAVNFDILEGYMDNADKIAEDFKKAAYSIGDTIDFYGVWNREIEERIMKIFSVENKETVSSKYVIKFFEGKEDLSEKLFINHIDSDL